LAELNCILIMTVVTSYTKWLSMTLMLARVCSSNVTKQQNPNYIMIRLSKAQTFLKSPIVLFVVHVVNE